MFFFSYTAIFAAKNIVEYPHPCYTARVIVLYPNITDAVSALSQESAKNTFRRCTASDGSLYPVSFNEL